MPRIDVIGLTIIVTALLLCLVALGIFAQRKSANAVLLAAVQRNDVIRAVERGDAAAVERLLSRGADANARNDAGETALIVAAGKGHVDVTRMLLDREAAVEARKQDYWNHTALIWAADRGQSEVVKLLLAKGADVNAQMVDDYTALMRTTDLPTVQALLAHGANINLKDTFGETAVMLAASSGQSDIVRILLDKGADIHARDRNGATAMMRAAGNGFPDVVKLLQQAGAKA